MNNYLPYAKSTILSRAIPGIDGLKPVHRRTLYTMYEMGLLNGNKTKSSNIVGQTMKLHPHGDAPIYGAMVRLSTGFDGLNAPYVEGKGNFGKVYARSIAYAAPRYTEAKLTPICKELFDGIKEDAVDMVPNFDQTCEEPALLPVKFPSVLVNTSGGIAVGKSSMIPSFGLKNVCNSVIGILEGNIDGPETLVNTLGIPEFTNGGHVHTTREDMIKLIKSGRGSISVSGTLTSYTDSIVITEIPYKSDADDIVQDIEAYAKSGELKEVQSVEDYIDIKGFKLVVYLKRGANPKEVVRKLFRYTKLYSDVSFNTTVIINNQCREIGIYDLLREWIDFRVNTINRVYTYRLKKAQEQEYALATWEKINGSVEEAVKILANNVEDVAKKLLMQRFKLEDAQCEILLDQKLRNITTNFVAKKLNDLADVRTNIAEYQKILGSDSEKYRIIIEDQKRIIEKYGNKDNKTRIAQVIKPEQLEPPKEDDFVDDSKVNVVYTKNGYLKRLASVGAITNWQPDSDDEEVARFSTRNCDHILVFTYSGDVYKIPVSSIDASRGKAKDEVASIIGVDFKDIMLVDECGDYSKHFNVVYKNGRGYRVEYKEAAGKRKKYKSLFEPCKPGEIWWTYSDQFFMITARRKAAYCDLTTMGILNTRKAFKVARVSTGDSIFGLQDVKNVPDISRIDLDKYSKDYTVAIKFDELWPGAKQKYMEANGITEDPDDNTVEGMIRKGKELLAQKEAEAAKVENTENKIEEQVKEV